MGTMIQERKALLITIRDAAAQIERGVNPVMEEQLIRKMEQAASRLEALSARPKAPVS